MGSNRKGDIMTDAVNNPNAGQSEDPQNLHSLQEQAREETSKAGVRGDTPQPDENPDQRENFKPGAPGVPPVGNPD